MHHDSPGSPAAIRVDNIGKRYLLGERVTAYETLRESLTDGARRLLGGGRSAGGRAEIWALREVSFVVRPGEVVGSSAPTGREKSTLLKVLARITGPTTGRADVRGRLASLLEVGTGFHPELTGRENVYLNGTLLGMSRAEVRAKFDEIVEFAEVQEFIDTPVKRYSTGMNVRLAFAVAAHLDADILIVDEVLAVGDASFQRKCLSKMGDVSSSGRTILFVSHNMAAISTLCSRALLLHKGVLTMDTDVETAVGAYLSADNPADARRHWNEEDAPQSEEFRFCSVQVEAENQRVSPVLDCQESFSLVFEYEIRSPMRGARLAFIMLNQQGIIVCGSTDIDAWGDIAQEPGRYVSRCRFPEKLLNAGSYTITCGARKPPYTEPLCQAQNCISFQVEDLEGHGPLKQPLPGILRPALHWCVQPAGRDERP